MAEAKFFSDCVCRFEPDAPNFIGEAVRIGGYNINRLIPILLINFRG